MVTQDVVEKEKRGLISVVTVTENTTLYFFYIRPELHPPVSSDTKYNTAIVIVLSRDIPTIANILFIFKIRNS